MASTNLVDKIHEFAAQAGDTDRVLAQGTVTALQAATAAKQTADANVSSVTVTGTNMTVTKGTGEGATSETFSVGTTYGEATTSTSGLMSAADKTKLDGIEASANNYTHPTTAGNKHIPAGGSSGQILRWSSAGTAVWGNESSSDGTKVIPTLALDESVAAVDVGSTKAITFKTNSSGTVTVSTSNTRVATATVSGNTVTITGVGAGSASISVNVASTTTNYGVSENIDVNVKLVLEDVSWSDIQAIGAAGTGANYFDIGDTKSVALSGTVGTLAVSGTYYVFIIEFNYRGDNGIYFQGFKTADGVNIALCDASYGLYNSAGSKIFNMNHWGGSSSPYNTNYGGWKGCDFRYDILGSCTQAPSGYGATPTTSRSGYDATSAAKTSPVANTLMAALSAELRAVLAAWTVYTENKGNSSNTQANVTACIDYLTLLAEFEVHGARTYANQYEQNQQAQMAYYANGNSKIKYQHSANTTACNWWLRSPDSSYASLFCVVRAGGSMSNNYSRLSHGVAPAFRVA